MSGLFIPSASSVATPYLGQVATRCYMPKNNVTGAGRWQMTRSHHWMRDRTVNPICGNANWKVANNTETAYSGLTIKQSIEYPAGTMTLANENIAAGGAVAMNNGLTFLTFNVTIPEGAEFWVRTLLKGDNGVPFNFYQNTMSDYTEGWESGTGTVSDKTTTGSLAPNVITYSPILILGQTVRASFLDEGDSRGEGGWAGVQTDRNGDLGFGAYLLGDRYAYSSLSQSAQLLSTRLSGAHTFRDQLFPYFSHTVNAWGVNDFGTDGTLTVGAFVARCVTYATMAKALNPAIKVIGTTLPPYGNAGAGDNYATVAGQTLGGTNNVRVLAFNEMRRAGIPGEDGFLEFADRVDPLRQGTWPVDRSLTATSYRSAATVTGYITTIQLGTTGTFTNGSNQITNVGSTSGLIVGHVVQPGAGLYGVPWGTKVTGISGTTVTVSQPYQGTTTTGASFTFVGATLTVTAVTSGTLALGDPIASGTAIASSAVIVGLGTGTGGTGTYAVNVPQAAGSSGSPITITKGGFATIDALHGTGNLLQLMKSLGPFFLNR